MLAGVPLSAEAVIAASAGDEAAGVPAADTTNTAPVLDATSSWPVPLNDSPAIPVTPCAPRSTLWSTVPSVLLTREITFDVAEPSHNSAVAGSAPAWSSSPLRRSRELRQGADCASTTTTLLALPRSKYSTAARHP